MPEPDHRIALRDKLREGTTFEAALLSTFNLDFHFVEEVVLRYLRRTGIHYVVLLSDARQAGPLFLDPATAPAHAGRDYAFLPIPSSACFHPKCALMVGDKAARLIIGSHNLTLAGFGLNRELTNVIDIAGPSDAEGATSLVEAFDFHYAWAALLAPPLLERLDALAPYVAPYRASAGDVSDTIVLGSRPAGPSLWSALRPHLPKRATRITVLGPDYDSELAFVRCLHKDLSPHQMLLGVEPERTRFPSRPSSLPPGAVIANASELGTHDGHGLIHAKAIVIESDDGTWLVTGSANPTRSAWLDASPRKNAELILARHVSPSELESLGLPALWTCPPLSPTELAGLKRPGQVEGMTSGHRPLLGIRDEARVLIEGAPVGHELTLRDPFGEPIEHTLLRDNGDLVVDLATAKVAESATTFELSHGTDRYPGFVMHPVELREAAEPRANRRLRDLIDALNGEREGMEQWLASIDRVITNSSRTAAPKPRGSSTPNPSATAKRHTGPKVTEDFALLISYLMRHLWRKLPHLGAAASAARTPDVTSEDEDATASDPLDARVASLVTKKTATLLARMKKRLDQPDDPVHLLRETVAVLGMLQLLARDEQASRWEPYGLVDWPALGDWFVEVMPELLRKGGLVARVSAIDGQANDVAILVDLLVWVAWTSGFGPGEVAEDHEGLALSLLLATYLPPSLDLARRERILTQLERTPFEECDPAAWLDQLVGIGALGRDARSAPVLSRRPRPGDLVRPNAIPGARVFHSFNDAKLRLIDFDKRPQRDEDLPFSIYLMTHVTVVDPGDLTHPIGGG